MKNARFALVALIALIGLVGPNAVWADDIVAVSVSDLTFNGNFVCGLSGTSLCTETFTGSWLWDNTTLTVVPGSLQMNTTGPLGPFQNIQVFLPQPLSFVTFDVSDSASDTLVVDLNLPVVPGALPIQTPLVICGFGPCGGEFDVFEEPAASGTVSVSAAPEPPSIILLCTGLVSLVGAMSRKWLA